MLQTRRIFGSVFTARAVLAGFGGLLFTLLAIGVPTAVIPNGVFSRMTPVRPLDYLFLALTALLMGLLAALYTVPAGMCAVSGTRLTSAGVLSFLAVGCPVCNKIVLILLGASGAMSYWAPLQPLLGSASVVLLAATLILRVRQLRSGGCVSSFAPGQARQ